MAISAADLGTKVDTLQRNWMVRNKRFKTWYEQIQMIDRLAQKDMESFVGNDPRAAFNLLIGILDQIIPHRIDPEDLTSDQVAPAAELSYNFGKIWKKTNKSYRGRGRYFMRDLITFMLATGWYSVFSVISTDGTVCLAEVQNPATVFPAYDDVLTECAHKFVLTPAQAKRLAARNGWVVRSAYDKITCRDYWWLDDNGKVHNAISLDNDLVKVDTLEARFDRIPIFVMPVNGLPDTGEITTRRGDTWRGEIGQSFLATNENVYDYFNKWWTFLLQILRDYAQSRTYEKTNSAKQIINPEDWYKRGAHFKLGLQDEIGFLTPPPIPLEIRSTQLDMEAMMQRGFPTSAQYGNVPQGITSYVISQAVAATNNSAKAFHNGIVDCLSDIDNFWVRLMQEYNYKPYGYTIPSGLPSGFELTADYELRIPGDLAQRATSARMLNPEFTISEERIMEWNFPEIRNPKEEAVSRDFEKARRDPIFAQLSLISALRQEADALRKAKDIKTAQMYERVADAKEKELVGSQQPINVRDNGRSIVGNRPENIPPQRNVEAVR